MSDQARGFRVLLGSMNLICVSGGLQNDWEGLLVAPSFGMHILKGIYGICVLFGLGTWLIIETVTFHKVYIGNRLLGLERVGFPC